MSKRILSFLLAAVMVFGMIPFNAIPTFAAETTPTDKSYEAMVAQNITIDGSLSELSWMAGGKLSGGEAFDILWDGGNLYFAVKAGGTLTVAIGGKEILTATGTSVIEAKTPYVTQGVTEIQNVQLNLGDSSWTGNVNLVKYARSQKITTNLLGSPAYKGGATDPTVIGENEGYEFTKNEQYSETDGYRQCRYTSSSVIFNYNRTTDYSFEFDFDPSGMAAQTYEGWQASSYATNGGFSAKLYDKTKQTLWFGMDNVVGKGLVFRMGQPSNNEFINLGRNEKDGAFHVRLEWIYADNSVRLYIDGELIHTFVGKVFTGTIERGALFELYTLPGLKDIETSFKLYNMSLSTPATLDYTEAPAAEAYVAPGTVTPDGNLDEVLWALPNELKHVTGTGVSGAAYMAWSKGILHLAVEHSGASELYIALRDKAWTVPLTGENISVDNGLVTGKNVNGVAELEIDMFGAGLDVLAYEQRENFQLKLTGATGTASLGLNKAALVFSERESALFTIPDPNPTSNSNPNTGTKINGQKEEFTGSGRQYVLLSTSNINHAKDVYLEQKITINAMPGSKGTVGKGYDASGLAIGIFESKTVSSVIVVYVDENNENNVTVRVGKANGAYEEKAIGKTLGQPFNLGYLWKADDTVCIYVDGKQILEAANATYNVNWGAGTYAYNMASLSDYDVVIEDVAHTVSMNKKTPTNTTAGILGDLDTTNVTGKLPNGFVNGHFKYGVTWQSSNHDVIAADGTVTRPTGDDATVTVAAVVGGTPLEGITVTVPAAEPEMVIAKGTYDAFVAQGITADGNLSETAWRTGAELGKGQPFDILWDGSNLYFGVVAADGDESMTVQIGGETIATAEKSGNGFEVKVPYTTKDVETIENLTITVGKSAWKGNVNLVKMAREVLRWSDMTTADGANITSTASGDGFSAHIPARTAPGSTLTSYNIYKTNLATLTANPEEVGVVFDLDPTGMPAVASNSVDSAAWPAYSGMRLVVAKANGTALQLCIFNHSGTGTLYLVSQLGNTKVRNMLDLERTAADGAFELNLLWHKDGSLGVYIESEFVGTIATAQVSDTNMADTNTATNNMIYFTAHRYDYSANDHRKDYYAQSVDFTVSKLALSMPVEVTYPDPEPDEPDDGAESYDAFVATGVTANGNMSETAWFTGGKLSGGQPFDILWDGDNLYFGVKAATGDTQLTVKLGEETLGNATLAEGASAFELKVAHDNYGVTKLENVTLTVGESTWTGDVKLVNMGRTYTLDFAGDNCSRGYEYYDKSTDYTNLSFTKTATSATFSNVYKEGAPNLANGRIYALQIGKGFNMAENRTDDRVIEFDFYAEHLPAYSNSTHIGAVYAAYGLAATISDSNKDGIQFGIKKAVDNELYFVIVGQTTDSDKDAACQKPVQYIKLDKHEGEEFSVRVVWTADNSVSVYIDGVLKGTAENMLHKACLGASTFGFQLWGPGSVMTADGANDNEFTVSNVRVAAPVEVVYASEKIMDAFIAEDITVDGNLNEMSWRPFQTLSGGQPFDVLFDGKNLYFAVVAKEGDETLTVKLGSNTLTTATLAEGAAAFEVKADFETKNVTALESLTLTVGESTWTGKVNLVSLARRELVNVGNSKTPETGVTATGNNGIAFKLDPITAATGSVGNVYAFRTGLDLLEDRNCDVAIEFNFDPTDMPINENTDSIGRAYAVYSGLEILMVDGDGTAAVFGIGNSADGLYANVVYNGSRAGSVLLNRSIDDGAFDVKAVWTIEGSLELYIDGTKMLTVANATSSDAEMGQSGYTTHNMVLIRASRYDYNDMFLGKGVEFTVSDVKVGCEVGATFVSTGTYDAFVAKDITINGAAAETSWRTAGKMGAGQPFDILWDGDNIYVTVIPNEGDTELVVKQGKTVLGSATLAAGASAFELKIPYDNFAVNTLENISLVVGTSYWKGTVNLVKLTRVDKLLRADMSVGYGGTLAGRHIEATADGNGMEFFIPAATALSTDGVTSAVALKTPLNALTNRTSDIVFEFHFDPASLPQVSSLGSIGAAYVSWGGFDFGLFDANGNSIACSIINYNDNLYMNVKTKAGVSEATRANLNRSVADGDFEVKLVWQINNTLNIYVDGVLVKTVANAAAGSGVMGDSHTNKVLLRAIRRDYDANNGYKTPLKVTVSNLRLSVPAEVTYSNIPTFDALLTQEPMTIDGNLTEVAWLDWLRVNEPSGNLAAAWSKGNLFLAVHSTDADALELNINGKAATLNLATGAITGYANAVVAKNAKTGLYEIQIPLGDIGFNPTDYNQSVPFTAKLVKGTKTATFKAGYLSFSGKIAEIQSLGNYTKNSGPFTLLGNEATYIGKQAGALHYMYKIENEIYHNGLFVFSTDLQFNKLPISTGKQTGGSEADGFFYYFSDEDKDTRNGVTVFTVIFTEDGTNLKMRIGAGGGQEGTVFDLNKTLGEKFRVTQYWYADDSLAIYIDGVLLGIVTDASYGTSSMGVDVITYRYKSNQATNQNVNILIGNQTKIVRKYNKVTDELTPNVVFGRADLEHVQKNLNMVTSYTSANFEALPLRWTTTNASVVETDGTVHRHATEPKSATVAVYYGNDTTPLWSVTVTVDPMNVSHNAAPSLIHTAFGHDDSITLDGSLEGESWLLNGWVLNDQKQLVGYFGTQWNQNYLYIALDVLEAKTVSLTLGNKTITVDMAAKTISGAEGEIAVNGSVAEIKIPVAELFGEAKLQDSGAELAITVTMDGNAYAGKLYLTNVDWWATDNLHNGLPMLANNVKSVKEVGEDDPNGNHGAKQLENGYRFYDLYDPNGTNPRNIRTYVLFMKQPIYEGFADRSGATFIEFDFDAKALPEWEWDEGMKVGLSRAFSNFGVTFSLSDKADSAKSSNVAVFGIVNTAEGLYFVGRRGSEDYVGLPLNKTVGEPFRLGLSWELDGTLRLYIDGVEFDAIPGMSVFDNAVGDTSFVVNMVRNSTKPTSEADNMEVYITNIAFGKVFGTENLVQNLTFDTIKGENDDSTDIFADLNLPKYITNGQLDHQHSVTWTSSDEDTIDPETGKVTRPATGVKAVTLTATIDNNGTVETKKFVLYVSGLEVSNGNALVCAEDTNPFGKSGYEYMSNLYYLDKTNNSVIYAFSEGEVKKINLVTLTDLDEISRLNRESLRLFVSDDNVTYTEIEDYKLHHDGYNWYLYNFETESRYIKVHYTHRDSDDANFVNTPGEMIKVSWNEGLVVPEDAVEIAVPTTTLRDQAVAITLPAGITNEGLRVALNGEILFHYVDKKGTVYIRIADPTTGTLQLWNVNDIELADKENVYEVTYGTRETLPTSARWILSVKAGTVFPDGSAVDVDTLYNMSGASVTKSTDGGYTWTSVGKINIDKSLNTGGWGFDSKTKRMFHESHIVDNWDEHNKYNSQCTTVVHYSDDGGKTWTKAEGLGVFNRNGFYTNYILSYTDMTELAGNDGTGPNVDFVFPMGAQYNNNGAFCGLIAYTKDGGKTWDYSNSVITFGNELAFEGGVSEATILEREDGTLVYYARCQSAGVDNFTISYSLDHGVTWLTPGETSTVYTTNTQALMMTYDFGGFDGNRLTGTPMFMWGGNNVMGGGSYMRVPLNFAISTNGMDTFRQVQNIFFKTFMDVYDFEADHYITNASIQQVNNHDMYVSFSRLRVHDSIYMVVNDFTDWFERTKGAYDSFEHGTAVYEGWVTQRGTADVTTDMASEGNYGLRVDRGAIITRSVPYLQNGMLSVDLYVDSSSNFTFELQPAFAIKTNKCAVISAHVKDLKVTFQDGTQLALREGWNKFVFELELTELEASVQINGGKDYALQINTIFDNGSGMQASHELGNYITYMTIINEGTAVYADEFFVESTLDPVLEATNADQAAADAVIEKIKAIENATGNAKVEAIAAAREAYDALTQVQKDLVNRRVRNSDADESVKITSGKITDYMTNYYDVLVAAENAVVESAGDPEIKMLNATLNDYIRVGVWTILPDAYSNATMQFSYNGKTVSASASEKRSWNGVEYTVFYLDLAAKEMADEITATLKHNGAVVDQATTTIRKYLDSVNGSESESTETKTLVQAMASYGAAAQIYFNHNAGNLADENTKYEVPFDKNVAMEDLKNHVADKGKTDGKAKLWGLNLVLEERTVLRFIFDVDDSVAGSFKVTDKNGAVLDTEKRNGKYYVHVYGIAAKDLDEMVELTVTDGTSTWTVAASPLTYCHIILNAAEGTYSENLVNVVKALYNYNQTANAYFD